MDNVKAVTDYGLGHIETGSVKSISWLIRYTIQTYYHERKILKNKAKQYKFIDSFIL